jgi:hypothetical protein
MKFFSITVLLAFATRSVRSEELSWACTGLMADSAMTTPSTSMSALDMVKARTKLPVRHLKKSSKGSKGSKGTAKGAAKASKGMGPKAPKGAKKGGNKAVKGAKKGNKSNGGGDVASGNRCPVGQENLSFVIFPDQDEPLAVEVNGPQAGLVFFFEGDFIGIQTQSLLFLAEGLIVQGQDSFVFFDAVTEDDVGSIAVLFGNGIPVIAGGTGIFLGADGSPQMSRDNEGQLIQFLFNICVSA